MDNLQKQAENNYPIALARWRTPEQGVLAERAAFISGYSTSHAEVERLREALKEVHGLCMALRHGIFSDTDSVNMLISKAIIASSLPSQG